MAQPDRVRGAEQVRAGNVDRYIACRRVQMIQNNSSLEARATAIFDQQTIAPQYRRHLGSMTEENRRLRAREIILIELADLIEELRPALVVEEFAGKLLARPAKALQDLGSKVILDRLQIMQQN